MAERCGRLFEMNFKVLESCAKMANVAVEDTLREWHEKFAHQNIRHVKAILKANNIKVTNESASTSDDFFL